MPIYRQIANTLIGLIRGGMIKPGSLLPSVREMSDLLDVHRRTVVRVYEELANQDWVTTIPRKGIFVSTLLPEIKSPDVNSIARSPYSLEPSFSFGKATVADSPPFKRGVKFSVIINDGLPDPRIAPVELLFREYRKLYLSSSMHRKTTFIEQGGSYNLRVALAHYLSNSRGLRVAPENLLITRGAQMAMYLVTRLLLKPGSRVIVGEPNYGMANFMFQQCGAVLEKIPVDAEGIDVDVIEKICKRKKPELLYIIPHHHHPTTVTLSAERRMRLLHISRSYNVAVMEDDYDYDFHYNGSPILPLAGGDHNGNVIYIGSVSKSFTSTLKIGYLVGPAGFVQQCARLRRIIDVHGDIILEEALSKLFSNGDMDRHLKKSLKIYRERRNIFHTLIEEELKDFLVADKPDGGLAFWAKIEKGISLTEVSSKASRAGLFMSDGSFYNTGKVNYNALRIGFAALNENEIESAVSMLKKIKMAMKAKK